MKILRLLPWILLALLTGCLSPTITTYWQVTPEDIKQRMADNDGSAYSEWNAWRYAGSDDQFDYIYQYNPGAIAPYGFQGYKLPRGAIDVGRPYKFNPDFDGNRRLW